MFIAGQRGEGGKKGNIWGEGCRVCDFLLIGGWCGMVFQESWAQPEVTILHFGVWGRGGQFVKRTQRYSYACSSSRNQDSAPRLSHHLAVPPLFLHPLPSLISNCLNRPFGTQ